MSIAGIGYEGRTPEELLAELQDVDVLVDVRLNPISRKRGFSKRALSEAVEGAGIRYLHLSALGNPRDDRAGYGSTDAAEARAARERYRAILREEPARAALDEVVALARQRRVAVLCFEASDVHCHRHQVIEAVEERR